MKDSQKLLGDFGMVLDRLSAPAEVQVAYLSQLRSGPSLDELALEFDDIYRPLGWRLATVERGAELITACESLEASLRSETLGWAFADLDSDEWAAIRMLAQDARLKLSQMELGGAGWLAHSE
jgi:hypothetical protein